MTLLQFCPPQSHHKLHADGRVLSAGETWEASEEDVPDLIAQDNIREAPEGSATTKPATTDAKPPSGTADTDNLMGDSHAS